MYASNQGIGGMMDPGMTAMTNAMGNMQLAATNGAGGVGATQAASLAAYSRRTGGRPSRTNGAMERPTTVTVMRRYNLERLVDTLYDILECVLAA